MVAAGMCGNQYRYKVIKRYSSAVGCDFTTTVKRKKNGVEAHVWS